MKKLKTKKELKTMIKTAKELELKANNAMTVEKKKEVLHNAINKAWNGAFDEWEWEESEDRPNNKGAKLWTKSKKKLNYIIGYKELTIG